MKVSIPLKVTVKKKRNDPEHYMQCSIVEWIRSSGIIVFPELIQLASNTSGAARSFGQRKWFKAEGMETGFPDLYLPVRRCGYSGLYIELKMPKNKLREEQAFRIWSLRMQGFCAVVRYTKNDTINTLIDYMLNNGVVKPDHVLEWTPWKQPKKKDGSRKQEPPSFRQSPLYRHWQFSS